MTPEAKAAYRREKVMRMLLCLNAGQTGSRWELADWPVHPPADEMFLKKVVDQLVERGLVRTEPFTVAREGSRGATRSVRLSKAGDLTPLLTDEAVTELCWPGRSPAAPEQVDDLDDGPIPDGEDAPVEPGPDERLDTLLRIAGMLAENVVYLREKVDALPVPPPPRHVGLGDRDVDVVVSMLAEIERKVVVRPAVAPSPVPIELHAKLSDAIRSNNQIAVLMNEAVEGINTRLGRLEQGLGELLKRTTPLMNAMQQLNAATEAWNGAMPVMRELGTTATKHMALLNGVATALDRQVSATNDIVKSLDAMRRLAQSIAEFGAQLRSNAVIGGRT